MKSGGRGPPDLSERRLPPRGGSGLKFCPRRSSQAWGRSPSARREWIEITGMIDDAFGWAGLPPRGGSGLKLPPRVPLPRLAMSPSARREWIEIIIIARIEGVSQSPSARREWIEICPPSWLGVTGARSPSARREWIEISNPRMTYGHPPCLPPRGGSGLKLHRTRPCA